MLHNQLLVETSAAQCSSMEWTGCFAGNMGLLKSNSHDRYGDPVQTKGRAATRTNGDEKAKRCALTKLNDRADDRRRRIPCFYPDVHCRGFARPSLKRLKTTTHSFGGPAEEFTRLHRRSYAREC